MLMETGRQWNGCWPRTWQLKVNTSRPASWSSALQKRCRHSSTLTTRKLNVSWKSISTTKPCPSVPNPNTSEYRWTSRSRIVDTLSHFAKSWYHVSRSWGGLLRSNNSANSHPSPGAFNYRVLRFCLLSQCSHPPHRPCHQRHLANCDWMPASYTSRQPSNPRRHPICWASSQWSVTFSTLFYVVPWSLDTCFTQHLLVHRVHMHGALNWDTHLYPPHNNSSVHLTTTTYMRRSRRITSGMRSGRTISQDSGFSFPTPAPTPPE